MVAKQLTAASGPASFTFHLWKSCGMKSKGGVVISRVSNWRRREIGDLVLIFSIPAESFRVEPR